LKHRVRDKGKSVKQLIKSAAEVQVIDLVLDPFSYYDALKASICREQQDVIAADHLADVLPAAIAQLDAVGDDYGALALTGLSAQLARRASQDLKDAFVAPLLVVAEAY
jgi:hypothetical protein